MKKITVRRAVDIAVSRVGLTFFGLPILVAAGLAYLESGMPGLFVQTRYGLNGRPFGCMKIRTLDENFRPLRSTGWLRKIGCDELPQLVNVAHGDMSLIGPRPCMEIPQTEGWDRVLAVPPGIVGMNSILQKRDGRQNTYEEQAKIDGAYVEQRLLSGSFRQDMFILFQAARLIAKRLVDTGNEARHEQSRLAAQGQGPERGKEKTCSL
ncbi:MAG: sugar transferase [Bdellovibrionales bacterium]